MRRIDAPGAFSERGHRLVVETGQDAPGSGCQAMTPANAPLPPMPEPPDLSDVPSWDRTDVALGYYRLRSIALEARLRLVVEALKGLHDDNADYLRLNHLGGYDNHWMVQARKALAAIGDLPEEKP